jgi:hypothetical protein
MNFNGHQIFCKLILLAAITAGQFAFGAEIFEMNRNARAMGMGNAYSSLVDDEDALFYNPAGIAKNGGFFWTIADPGVGLSSLSTEDLDVYSNLQDSSTFNAALDSLYGKTIWAGGVGKTAVMLPFFAGALYGAGDVSVSVDNRVSPTMTVNYVRDTGIALGTGFWMGPFLQQGFAFKRINRVGSRQQFGPSVIQSIISGASPDVIFDSIERKGTGYAMDWGMNISIPGPVRPTISFVWKNIGNTKFTAANDGDLAPPTEEQEWVLGTSFMIDLPLVHIVPSIDLKHLNNEDEQLGKKLHMGVELGLPLLDLRVGSHQGYLSYGAGINLGLFRFDAATWGVEMGGYPGQNESRRYMAQFSLRLGFDLGIGQGSGGGGGDGKGGSGSGGSRGKSSWGGKPKQRR